MAKDLNVKNENIKMFIFCFIAVVILILSIVYYNGSVGSLEVMNSKKDNEVTNLQNELDIKKSKNESAKASLVQASTGLNVDRVTKDDKIAKEFISGVLTWDNGKEYDIKRKRLMDTYKLDANHSFVRVFLPENTKLSNGESYIDSNKLNSVFEQMKSYVRNIDKGRYSYFTFVTWSSVNEKHQQAVSTCIFTYTIDNDGMVSDINAYTLAR